MLRLLQFEYHLKQKIMKKVYLFIIALLPILFIACDKTSEDINPIEITDTKNTNNLKKGGGINNSGPTVVTSSTTTFANSYQLYSPDPTVPCAGSEPKLFIINYWLGNQELKECLSKSALFQALVNSGQSSSKAQQHVDKIFNTAHNKPAYYANIAKMVANEVLPTAHVQDLYIGRMWYKFEDTPQNCISGCDPTIGYLDCDEGQIDDVLELAGDFGNIWYSYPGFYSVAIRIQSTCDASIFEIINITPEDLRTALYKSPNTATWVEDTYERLILGTLTEREMFNTYQFFVVPNLPELTQLDPFATGCLYMSEAYWTVNYIHNGTAGFSKYAVLGHADLYCDDSQNMN